MISRPDVYVVSKRFGQNLKALRLRAGLDHQVDLAKRLGFRDSSRISHWESGRTLPEAETVTTLATALRCSPADLLAGVVTPYDALRGQQELPGPSLLLSDEETGLVTTWRALDPAVKTTLRETLLPALAAATTRMRRRHPRGRRRRGVTS